MAHHAKRGDLIAQLTPFVQSVKDDHLPNLCSYCLREGKLLKCTSCKVMRYCNATCQRNDWKFHKVECKCFRVNPFTNFLLHKKEYRIIIRLIIRYNKGETKLKSDEVQLRCFDDMMSHSEEIKNHSKSKDDFETLCSGLEMITRGILKLPGRDEILDIFGKYSINSFQVSTQAGGQAEGVAVYLSSSVFDHSCDPDVFISYYNNVQQIRAIRDFTYGKFSDIKISYTDILATSHERQKSLSRYFFTCQCTRCMDPTFMDKLMTSSKCPTKGCSCPILENADGTFAACSQCKNQKYPENYAALKTKAIDNCIKAFDKYEGSLAAIASAADELYRLYTDVLKDAINILHPSNVHLFRILDKAFRICGFFRNEEKTREALKYGRMKIESLKLLPHSDLHRCLYHKEVGHFEYALGHYREALEAFMAVGDDVSTMYGENHKLTLDLKKSIYESRIMLAM